MFRFETNPERGRNLCFMLEQIRLLAGQCKLLVERAKPTVETCLGQCGRRSCRAEPNDSGRLFEAFHGLLHVPFLSGACVLSADIRDRTWTKKRPCTGTNHDRWNAAALLLLKGSCGVSINATVAERAGPMFRGLQVASTAEKRKRPTARLWNTCICGASARL